jgi:hypothetical protein
MCILLVCVVSFDSSLVKVCVHPVAVFGQTFASTADGKATECLAKLDVCMMQGVYEDGEDLFSCHLISR